MARNKKQKLKSAKQKLRANPDDPETLAHLAGYYAKQKEYRRALQQFAKLFQTTAEAAPELYFLAADCHVKLAELNEAVTLYEQGIAACRRSASEDLYQAYLTLGELAARAGQLCKAWYAYHEAERLNPADADAATKALAVLIQISAANDSWQITADGWTRMPARRAEQKPVAALSGLTPSPATDHLARYVDDLESAARQEISGNIPALLTTLPALLPSLQENPVLSERARNAWQAIITRCLGQFPLTLDFGFFYLVASAKKAGWAGVTAHLHDTVAGALQSMEQNRTDYPIPALNRRFLMLLQDSCRDASAAVQTFIRWWENQAESLAVLALTTPLWNTLKKSQYLPEHAGIPVIQRYCEIISTLPGRYSYYGYHLLIRLGYSLDSSRAWNAQLFENVVVPVMHRYLTEHNFLGAYLYAERTDFTYAQQPHSEAQQRLCREAYLTQTLAAGRRIRATLPALPAVNRQTPINVGVVISMALNWASPIKLLLKLLTDAQKLQPCPFQVTVYAFAYVAPAHAEKLSAVFSHLGVKIVDMYQKRGCAEQDDFLERLLEMRDIMRQDNIQTVMYLQSPLFFVTLTAAIGLAPFQLYWAMGTEFRYRIPEIQGYLRFGGVSADKKNYFDYEWRLLPGVLAELHPTQPALLAFQAHQLRQQKFAGYTVLLGTLARPQKIDSDEFFDMLAAVLKSHPSVAFLWCGNEPLSSVQAKIQARGIEGQCFFEGYVNTKLYAKVLDIHLDTYPAATGITMLECMAAGCATVFREDSEAAGLMDTNTATLYILPALEASTAISCKTREIFKTDSDNSLFLYARTAQAYTAYVSRLIADSAFRKAVGQANREFIQLLEHINMAEAFAGHLSELIQAETTGTEGFFHERC